ncbi:MAG: hypothetical protein SH850_19120 [Planctomycetaceae bacterium]|nr:hypothetical protein [Planctomycetaceae bacterium]
MVRCLMLIGLLMSSTGVLHAAVYAPRVTVAGEADPYSIETWAQDAAWKELSDAEFAGRLFALLTDERRGLTVTEQSPREVVDPVPEFAAVADPVKLRHVYGYGSARVIAGSVAAAWQASGRGRGRLVERVETREWWTELESGGRWWVFNVPGREAFQPPNGGFVTLEDVQLVRDQKPVTHRRHEFPAPTGHTLDQILRRGERFTRYFQPQGKRWRLSAEEAKDAKLRKLLESEPVGPKAIGETKRPLFANGVIVYEPNLKTDPADYADGVLAAGNVAITEQGLSVVKDGEGYAIFEVASPYVIVPELGKLEDAKDDKDASVVEIDALGATLSFSPDEGATWITLETKEYPARVDLTANVAGLYGYLLRVDLKGKPSESVLKSLKITTWVQLAAGALPAVQTGANRFASRTGDAFGERTRAVVVTANTADENSFLRPVIRPPQEFKPGDKTGRVIGPFTLRLGTPYAAKIAWFSVGGTFANDPASPATASARIGYATGQPVGFTSLELPTLSQSHGGANYHLDRRVRLDPPANTVYLAMEGQPALNGLRLTAHVIEDRPREVSPMVITHRWTEAGAMKDHVFTTADSTAEYAFDAGAEVVNESVEMRGDGSPR